MLAGLLVQTKIDLSPPSAEQLAMDVAKSDELMRELHSALSLPMFESLRAVVAGGQSTPMNGEMLREPVFYTGDAAHGFQYRAFARAKYAADSEWLRQFQGFSIDEAAAVIEAAERLLSANIQGTLKLLAEDRVSFVEGFELGLEQLSAECGLSLDLTKRVIEAFSLQADGSANQSFVSFQSFNEVNAKPFIRLREGRYLLLQSYLLDQSLYESPFFWMASDRAYKDRSFAHRGLFTEVFARERLAAVFGAARVVSNVNVFDADNHLVGEIDVLVLYGDRAIVLQAKAKRLTLLARQGNDEHVEKDFREAVQKSYEQALLCSNALKSAKAYRFRRGDPEITVPPTLTQIFPRCPSPAALESCHPSRRSNIHGTEY